MDLKRKLFRKQRFNRKQPCLETNKDVDYHFTWKERFPGKIGEEINRGSYAAVFKARRTEDNMHCAIKKPHPHILSSAEFMESYKAEIEMHSKLNHPSIVSFYGACRVDDDLPPLIIMEKMWLSLYSFIEQKLLSDFPLLLKLHILLDVAEGVSYLHSRNIIHRDLTLSNILLTADLKAKLSDFGSVQDLNTTKCNPKRCSVPGNFRYMPPESFSNNPVCAPKLDIFSFGCNILCIINETIPNKDDQFSKIDVADNYLRNMPRKHPLLKLLAATCLAYEPEYRPDIESVLAVLSIIISSPVFLPCNEQNVQTSCTSGVKKADINIAHIACRKRLKELKEYGSSKTISCYEILANSTSVLDFFQHNTPQCDQHMWLCNLVTKFDHALIEVYLTCLEVCSLHFFDVSSFIQPNTSLNTVSISSSSYCKAIVMTTATPASTSVSYAVAFSQSSLKLTEQNENVDFTSSKKQIFTVITVIKEKSSTTNAIPTTFNILLLKPSGNANNTALKKKMSYRKIEEHHLQVSIEKPLLMEPKLHIQQPVLFQDSLFEESCTKKQEKPILAFSICFTSTSLVSVYSHLLAAGLWVNSNSEYQVELNPIQSAKSSLTSFHYCIPNNNHYNEQKSVDFYTKAKQHSLSSVSTSEADIVLKELHKTIALDTLLPCQIEYSIFESIECLGSHPNVMVILYSSVRSSHTNSQVVTSLKLRVTCGDYVTPQFSSVVIKYCSVVTVNVENSSNKRFLSLCQSEQLHAAALASAIHKPLEILSTVVAEEHCSTSASLAVTTLSVLNAATSLPKEALRKCDTMKCTKELDEWLFLNITKGLMANSSFLWSLPLLQSNLYESILTIALTKSCFYMTNSAENFNIHHYQCNVYSCSCSIQVLAAASTSKCTDQLFCITYNYQICTSITYERLQSKQYKQYMFCHQEFIAIILQTYGFVLSTDYSDISNYLQLSTKQKWCMLPGMLHHDDADLFNNILQLETHSHKDNIANSEILYLSTDLLLHNIQVSVSLKSRALRDNNLHSLNFATGKYQWCHTVKCFKSTLSIEYINMLGSTEQLIPSHQGEQLLNTALAVVTYNVTSELCTTLCSSQLRIRFICTESTLGVQQVTSCGSKAFSSSYCCTLNKSHCNKHKSIDFYPKVNQKCLSVNASKPDVMLCAQMKYLCNTTALDTLFPYQYKDHIVKYLDIHSNPITFSCSGEQSIQPNPHASLNLHITSGDTTSQVSFFAINCSSLVAVNAESSSCEQHSPLCHNKLLHRVVLSHVVCRKSEVLSIKDAVECRNTSTSFLNIKFCKGITTLRTSSNAAQCSPKKVPKEHDVMMHTDGLDEWLFLHITKGLMVNSVFLCSLPLLQSYLHKLLSTFTPTNSHFSEPTITETPNLHHYQDTVSIKSMKVPVDYENFLYMIILCGNHYGCNNILIALFRLFQIQCKFWDLLTQHVEVISYKCSLQCNVYSYSCSIQVPAVMSTIQCTDQLFCITYNYQICTDIADERLQSKQYKQYMYCHQEFITIILQTYGFVLSTDYSDISNYLQHSTKQKWSMLPGLLHHDVDLFNSILQLETYNHEDGIANLRILYLSIDLLLVNIQVSVLLKSRALIDNNLHSLNTATSIYQWCHTVISFESTLSIECINMLGSTEQLIPSHQGEQLLNTALAAVTYNATDELCTTPCPSQSRRKFVHTESTLCVHQVTSCGSKVYSSSHCCTPNKSNCNKHKSIDFYLEVNQESFSVNASEADVMLCAQMKYLCNTTALDTLFPYQSEDHIAKYLDTHSNPIAFTCSGEQSTQPNPNTSLNLHVTNGDDVTSQVSFVAINCSSLVAVNAESSSREQHSPLCHNKLSHRVVLSHVVCRKSEISLSKDAVKYSNTSSTSLNIKFCKAIANLRTLSNTAQYTPTKTPKEHDAMKHIDELDELHIIKGLMVNNAFMWSLPLLQSYLHKLLSTITPTNSHFNEPTSNLHHYQDAVSTKSMKVPFDHENFLYAIKLFGNHYGSNSIIFALFRMLQIQSKCWDVLAQHVEVISCKHSLQCNVYSYSCSIQVPTVMSTIKCTDQLLYITYIYQVCTSIADERLQAKQYKLYMYCYQEFITINLQKYCLVLSADFSSICNYLQLSSKQKHHSSCDAGGMLPGMHNHNDADLFISVLQLETYSHEDSIANSIILCLSIDLLVAKSVSLKSRGLRDNSATGMDQWCHTVINFESTLSINMPESTEEFISSNQGEQLLNAALAAVTYNVTSELRTVLCPSQSRIGFIHTESACIKQVTSFGSNVFSNVHCWKPNNNHSGPKSVHFYTKANQKGLSVTISEVNVMLCTQMKNLCNTTALDAIFPCHYEDPIFESLKCLDSHPNPQTISYTGAQSSQLNLQVVAALKLHARGGDHKTSQVSSIAIKYYSIVTGNIKSSSSEQGLILFQLHNEQTHIAVLPGVVCKQSEISSAEVANGHHIASTSLVCDTVNTFRRYASDNSTLIQPYQYHDAHCTCCRGFYQYEFLYLRLIRQKQVVFNLQCNFHLCIYDNGRSVASFQGMNMYVDHQFYISLCNGETIRRPSCNGLKISLTNKVNNIPSLNVQGNAFKKLQLLKMQNRLLGEVEVPVNGKELSISLQLSVSSQDDMHVINTDKWYYTMVNRNRMPGTIKQLTSSHQPSINEVMMTTTWYEHPPSIVKVIEVALHVSETPSASSFIPYHGLENINMTVQCIRNNRSKETSSADLYCTQCKDIRMLSLSEMLHLFLQAICHGTFINHHNFRHTYCCISAEESTAYTSGQSRIELTQTKCHSNVEAALYSEKPQNEDGHTSAKYNGNDQRKSKNCNTHRNKHGHGSRHNRRKKDDNRNDKINRHDACDKPAWISTLKWYCFLLLLLVLILYHMWLCLPDNLLIQLTNKHNGSANVTFNSYPPGVSNKKTACQLIKPGWMNKKCDCNTFKPHIKTLFKAASGKTTCVRLSNFHLYKAKQTSAVNSEPLASISLLCDLTVLYKLHLPTVIKSKSYRMHVWNPGIEYFWYDVSVIQEEKLQQTVFKMLTVQRLVPLLQPFCTLLNEDLLLRVRPFYINTLKPCMFNHNCLNSMMDCKAITCFYNIFGLCYGTQYLPIHCFYHIISMPNQQCTFSCNVKSGFSKSTSILGYRVTQFYIIHTLYDYESSQNCSNSRCCINKLEYEENSSHCNSNGNNSGIRNGNNHDKNNHNIERDFNSPHFLLTLQLPMLPLVIFELFTFIHFCVISYQVTNNVIKYFNVNKMMRYTYSLIGSNAINKILFSRIHRWIFHIESNVLEHKIIVKCLPNFNLHEGKIPRQTISECIGFKRKICSQLSLDNIIPSRSISEVTNEHTIIAHCLQESTVDAQGIPQNTLLHLTHTIQALVKENNGVDTFRPVASGCTNNHYSNVDTECGQDVFDTWQMVTGRTINYYSDIDTRCSQDVFDTWELVIGHIVLCRFSGIKALPNEQHHKIIHGNNINAVTSFTFENFDVLLTPPREVDLDDNCDQDNIGIGPVEDNEELFITQVQDTPLDSSQTYLKMVKPFLELLGTGEHTGSGIQHDRINDELLAHPTQERERTNGATILVYTGLEGGVYSNIHSELTEEDELNLNCHNATEYEATHRESHLTYTSSVLEMAEDESFLSYQSSNQSIEYPVIEVSSFGYQSNAYEVIDEEQLQLREELEGAEP